MSETGKSSRGIAYDDVGSGLAVILMHGIMSNRTVFDGVVERLRPDYRVINVDLRGHGDSEPANSYELTDFSTDVVALIEQLGAVPAAMVGWSMGGTVALDIALCRPELLSRLVLVDGTPSLMKRPDWEPGLSPSAAEGLGALLAEDWDQGAATFAGLVLGDTSDKVRRTYTAVTQAARPDVTLTCFSTMGGLDLRERLTQIGLPVRVIVGAEDGVCPAPASEYLAAQLGGELEVIPDAGHAPFLTMPDAFEAALRRALAS